MKGNETNYNNILVGGVLRNYNNSYHVKLNNNASMISLENCKQYHIWKVCNNFKIDSLNSCNADEEKDLSSITHIITSELLITFFSDRANEETSKYLPIPYNMVLW